MPLRFDDTHLCLLRNQSPRRDHPPAPDRPRANPAPRATLQASTHRLDPIPQNHRRPPGPIRVGQNIAKRRLALGVSSHIKRLVDTWDRDDPDPIIADTDLRDVVVEKSNIRRFGQFPPLYRRSVDCLPNIAPRQFFLLLTGYSHCIKHGLYSM